jgi:hypothetical protein
MSFLKEVVSHIFYRIFSLNIYKIWCANLVSSLNAKFFSFMSLSETSQLILKFFDMELCPLIFV